MDENEIVAKIKALLPIKDDISTSEYTNTMATIAELHRMLNNIPDRLPALICVNCGLVTRSVFDFTEHYDNDTTGHCSDVHY